MLQSRLSRWLTILVALHLVGGVTAIALLRSGQGPLGQFVGAVGDVATALWLFVGAYQMWGGDRRVRWAAAISPLILVTLLILRLWMGEYRAAATAVSGIFVMTVAFLGGARVIHALLAGSYPWVGMARVTLDEAVRMKAVLVFYAVIAVMLPLLPFLMDPGERVQYRMQFFLHWSLSVTSVFLSFLTIFLAVGTITNDLKNKHIYMSMVKPLGRFQYLMGRWAGILLVDVLLLTIAGTGIYLFMEVVRAGPSQGEVDRLKMEEEVLVARVGITPKPAEANFFDTEYKKRLEVLRNEDPEHWNGELNSDQQAAIHGHVLAQWHTIPPLNSKTFVFEGLEDAAKYGKVVILRYKPGTITRPDDQLVRLAFLVNNIPWPATPQGIPLQKASPAAQFTTLAIPVEFIEKGRLEIRIGNFDLRDPALTFPTNITFSPGKDLELLYRVDTFANNYLRTLGVILIRLAFLAMIALACGTFLEFPMACLLALLVFVAASGASYIHESLDFYQELEINEKPFWTQIIITLQTFVDRIREGEYFSSFRIVVKVLGLTVMAVVPSFAEFSPVSLMSDGRLVSWQMLGAALWKVGLLWTGLATLLAWLLFRRKELARVIV